MCLVETGRPQESEGGTRYPAPTNWPTKDGDRFSKKKLKETEPALRKTMIEPEAVLSITRQCELLSHSLGRFYYLPVEWTERDLHLMP